MRSGELSLAIEIPSGFGRDMKRGRDTELAVWVDGAMPFRGETILGYVQGMHISYLSEQARQAWGEVPTLSLVSLEDRYRYNQDFRSLDAMVPAVIPILLIFIPAILMALGIVREKELGSITNCTSLRLPGGVPGRQALPYIAFSMVSYLSLVALAVWVFCALTGGFDPDPGCPALCVRHHWTGTGDVGFRPHPDCRPGRHGDYHHVAHGAVFRHDRAGVFAGRYR